MSTTELIRVQVPDMPSADELLPYLRRLDETKTYVNDGPLVRQLEQRLSAHYEAPVITVSSGTAALQLALQASGVRPGDRVLLPALTFSATGLAAHAAWGQAVLHDVSTETLTLDATACRRTLAEQQSTHALEWDQGHDWAASPARAVVPVATFGRYLLTTPWEDFPVPVVIDAAGAPLNQRCPTDENIVTCFSLHATKFLGAGEGGFIATYNAAVLDEVRSRRAFGKGGGNYKLSEYHAAVAQASLDRAESKAAATWIVANWYYQHGLGALTFQAPTRWSTVLVVTVPDANLAAAYLRKFGIETRQWYRPWLNEREDFPATALPVTDGLRNRLLGLPFHNFLTEADVAKVMDTLREVTKHEV